MTSQAALDSDQIRVVEAVWPSGWAPDLKGRGFKSTDLDWFLAAVMFENRQLACLCQIGIVFC